VEITELVLKVTSICNLNCKYCYVFNKGDLSYKEESEVMPEKVYKKVIERIREHCINNNIGKFTIIFHGGEPLLAGKFFYIDFIKEINKKISGVEISFGLQTNGTLITEEWISLFNSLGISVGVSIDGTREASEYRIFRQSGKSAYDEIIKGINILRENDYPIRVLSVINVDVSPESLYILIKELNVQFMDVLFPDKTYEHKNSKDKLIGNWLIKLFDIWYKDNEKPIIRIFDLIIGLILGVERGNETLGQRENKIITVKSNGNIQAVDSLMICGNGFTKTGYNAFDNSFDDALNHPLLKKYYYYHKEKELCMECRKCILVSICGGGTLSHRFSIKNGFDNPSVYCEEIKKIIIHIQNVIFTDLKKYTQENIKMDLLSRDDL
jgi:uncharacterized protein